MRCCHGTHRQSENRGERRGVTSSPPLHTCSAEDKHNAPSPPKNKKGQTVISETCRFNLLPARRDLTFARPPGTLPVSQMSAYKRGVFQCCQVKPSWRARNEQNSISFCGKLSRGEGISKANESGSCLLLHTTENIQQRERKPKGHRLFDLKPNSLDGNGCLGRFGCTEVKSSQPLVLAGPLHGS